MLQRKSKRILIYFFLLILFGTVNNINIKNLSFYEVKNINISGLNEKNNNYLLKSFKNLNLKNLFFLNKIEIQSILNSNTVIESYKVFKKYPSTLYIEIERTKFLARINVDGKLFLLGSNGKFSSDNLNKKLPYIFGKPEVEDFLKFIKIIDRSKLPYNDIKNFYFFPSKRWDLELKKNNILVKLPREYNENILNNVFKLLNQENFKNVKILDARVKNQIILND